MKQKEFTLTLNAGSCYEDLLNILSVNGYMTKVVSCPNGQQTYNECDKQITIYDTRESTLQNLVVDVSYNETNLNSK